MRLKNKIVRTKFIPGKLYKYNKSVPDVEGKIRRDYPLWIKVKSMTAVIVPVDAPIMFVEKTKPDENNNTIYWFLYKGNLCAWRNNLAPLMFIKAEEETTDQC